MTSIFLWRVFLKKKNLKIYVFHFLIVFPADFFFSKLLSSQRWPFHPRLQLSNTKLYSNVPVIYGPPSKLHNSCSHCFREEARNVNTVTEKACVGSAGVHCLATGVICKNSFRIVYPLMIPQLCKRKWKQDFMLRRCDLHNAGNGSHMIVLGFMAEGENEEARTHCYRKWIESLR